jgi:hypothetical protein
VHFALGDMDGFVAGLEGALRHHSLPLLELLYSPLFAAGRADPRIQDILRRQVEIQHEPGPKDSVQRHQSID